MFQVDKPSHPIEIFYSYSHKDGKLRDKLETHLSGMKREGIIAGWHDRKINAGKEWAGEIDKHINSAQIILWLVSPDFIASDYCYGKEMTQALERQILGEARIIPIIIRPCDWHSVLGPYEVLPIDGKPVTSRSWHNQDEAFLNIVKGIRSIIKEIGERKAKRSASQTTYELAKITENKHILVVEDLHLLSRGYRMIFEDKGFHVTCLLDGKEALDFTERIFV